MGSLAAFLALLTPGEFFFYIVINFVIPYKVIQVRVFSFEIYKKQMRDGQTKFLKYITPFGWLKINTLLHMQDKGLTWQSTHPTARAW